MTARPTIEQLQGVRKCPLHNAYIQSFRASTPGRPLLRYCPRCETEKAWEKAKQEKADREAGIVKPNLIIRKI